MLRNVSRVLVVISESRRNYRMEVIITINLMQSSSQKITLYLVLELLPLIYISLCLRFLEYISSSFHDDFIVLASKFQEEI